MGNKPPSWLIISIIAWILLLVLVILIFPQYRGPKPIGNRDKPFLTLTEYPLSNANYFYGPTLDGKEILFSQRKGSIPNSRCEIYSKSLETNKTKLVIRLDFHCPPSAFLSKDRDYLFFEISNAIMDKIATEAYNYYNLVNSYKKSIYACDIKEKNLILLRKGLEKVDYASQGGIVTGTDYTLIGPSPTENNEILVIKETSDIVPKFVGGSFVNVSKIENTVVVYALLSQQDILVFNESYNPASIDDEGYPPYQYQPSLTRWSPKGDAVILERGRIDSLAEKLDIISRGGVNGIGQNISQNIQYIIYLDKLELKELNPLSVQDDISNCGYYYNENLIYYQQLSEPTEYVIFFPDGKTYLRRYAEPSLGAPTEFDYMLKFSSSPYCTSPL